MDIQFKFIFVAWCTYPINETLVHQQLSLHQPHNRHPPQRLPKRFFAYVTLQFTIYAYKIVTKCIERATVLCAHVTCECKAGECMPCCSRLIKLMSGSSLESNALRNYNTLNCKAFYFKSCEHCFPIKSLLTNILPTYNTTL